MAACVKGRLRDAHRRRSPWALAMALFLWTGLLVGATAVALSANERDYYDTYRYSTMDFLGNKDGADIFRDRKTGVFYVDDGWDVRRVGTKGWVAHPVDVERFQALAKKYNPSLLQWTDFMLCTFEGREQALWDNFQVKYVVGAKPAEPTWGKHIRKQRWAEYYEELERWEANKKQADAIYRDECVAWQLRRDQYNEQHAEDVTRNAGVALLRRALSQDQPIVVNVGTQIHAPPMPMATYMATVPEGKGPGDTFLASVNGTAVQVTVPAGCGPGSQVQFQGPAPMQQATPVAAAKPQRPPPALAAQAPPPPAISASQAPPPPAIAPKAPAVPPAIPAPAVPQAVRPQTSNRDLNASLQSQSSMRW